MRFVVALALLVAGTVLAPLLFGFAPIWLLLPAASVLAVLVSHRWRGVMRELSFLSAVVNCLALFYIVPVLLSVALFVLAGLVAPRLADPNEDG